MKSTDVIKKLTAAGFTAKPGKGSHVKLTHPDGRTTIVPNHNGDDIGKGLLKAIEKQSKTKLSE